MPFQIALLVHGGITYFIMGIAWFVHIVHYPLLQTIQKSAREKFEKVHWHYAADKAALLLSIEALSAIGLLVFDARSVVLWLNIVLIAIANYLTWMRCVPLHKRMKSSCTVDDVTSLRQMHAYRTMIWSLRSVIVFIVLYLHG